MNFFEQLATQAGLSHSIAQAPVRPDTAFLDSIEHTVESNDPAPSSGPAPDSTQPSVSVPAAPASPDSSGSDHVSGHAETSPPIAVADSLQTIHSSAAAEPQPDAAPDAAAFVAAYPSGQAPESSSVAVPPDSGDPATPDAALQAVFDWIAAGDPQGGKAATRLDELLQAHASPDSDRAPETPVLADSAAAESAPPDTPPAPTIYEQSATPVAAEPHHEPPSLPIPHAVPSFGPAPVPAPAAAAGKPKPTEPSQPVIQIDSIQVTVASSSPPPPAPTAAPGPAPAAVPRANPSNYLRRRYIIPH